MNFGKANTVRISGPPEAGTLLIPARKRTTPGFRTVFAFVEVAKGICFEDLSHPRLLEGGAQALLGRGRA